MIAFLVFIKTVLFFILNQLFIYINNDNYGIYFVVIRVEPNTLFRASIFLTETLLYDIIIM